MANIKISELTALTPPDAADLVPVTDSSASQTKRTTVGEIVGIINGDVDVANDGTATINELPVSKLQDGAARQLLQTDAAGTGVEWTSNVDVPGTLDVTGATTLDAALNVVGLASLDGGIDVDGAFTVADTSGNIATSGTLGVDGQSTLASAAVSDLTSGRVVLAGTSGELQDNAGLTFDGTQLDVDGDLVVAGSLVFEGSTADDFETTLAVTDPTVDRTITLPDVSGTVVTTGDTGSVTSTMIADGTIVNADVSATAEIAVSKLANGTANQVIVTDGTNVSWSDDLTLAGNLTVNGTTTTINTETLTVKDKNIELGVVASPTDVTADGGGITLKGSTDKTINWVDATDAWTSSEHINIASGKEYRIDGTKVLDATSLGSAVVSSSLTSVGTISSGTWQGTAIDAAYLDSTVVTTGDTGTVTSTMIADGTIVNADINASAAIADTKLATISTAGKVSNSATTATSANTASAIVARDGSGNFSAGTITAALTGNADTATALSSSRTFAVTGDVTGTVSSDLTSGASIATSIESGVIVDGDVNDSAAIAGTKIAPDFGSQTVETTGDLAINTDTLFVDASANAVGIGTTSPAQNIHVTGNQTRILIDSANSISNIGINFGDNGAIVGGVLYSNSDDALLFQTNGTTERARIDSSGRLLVGTSSDSGGALFQVNDNRIRVATAKTPASASDTGTTGEICWDASYVYVCTATNTWKRAALATW